MEGEEGTPVVSIWWHKVPVADRPGVFRTIPASRHVMVFNYEQCRGLKKKLRAPVIGTFVHDPLVEAEALVAAMPAPPAVEEDGGQAYYDPDRDVVRIPRPEHFERRVDYYAVLFHELAHSTAHKSRLNRACPEPWEEREYGQEELIAEMAAAFLCGQTGIFDQTLDHSATYLHCWLKNLRGDPRLLLTATAQAQKAADYILGHVPSRAPADAAMPQEFDSLRI